jgi:DNA-binding Lrp family transcriptional regulator
MKALCERLAENEYVMWINTFIGRYDLQIIVDAVDGFHLNSIKEDIFRRCNHTVKEYSILTHLSDLEFTQLNPMLDLGTKFDKNSDQTFGSPITKRNFPVEPIFEKYHPTKYEMEILKHLADNPRMSLMDLSEKVNCDRQTIKKRVSNLIRKKVILNFGGIPDLRALGYVTYYLLVRLVQDVPLKELKKPFQQLRNIFYAGRMIGDYDLILYLNARNPEELNKSIGLFRADVGKYIVHYDLLVQDQVHHWRQFTKGIHDTLSERQV